VPKHNGTRHAFWAEADCRNFGPLLQGAEQKHAEVSGSVGSEWKAVEDSGRVRSHAEASGRPGRGRKRLGRLWERAEEAGRLEKITVHYTA